ncbi:MAG: (acid phosphatase) superfamily protein-like protein [Ramlibacter sp.]|jgi:membrane-associated PAP2 superfamily phosphatase|uniref:phosphatase PAP2 family protein n=1 Tax=Ramlibacter sp. TaxID=1917967 RepID=UPI0026372896|nr:phosphatase PAP2 family protein [Ramlibacter sp.]MDB5753104.1 (acid phosphatase) superfamily protein-like protein [Ramlibacter sp.]
MSAVTTPHPHRQRLFLLTALGLAGLLAWDASSLDLLIAAHMAGPEGFPLREHWVLTNVMHDGGRRLSWALATGLCLAVWWPVGPLRRLTVEDRIQLAVTTLCAALAVAVLKRFSATSCPWDLSLFGGFARYASHWSAVPDGGSGHCFPAGHASSGFSFIGGYFVFRRVAPDIARSWLLASLGAGLAFGVAQQLRGAHFMSHTLWTGLVCWAIAVAIDCGRHWPAPGALR